MVVLVGSQVVSRVFLRVKRAVILRSSSLRRRMSMLYSGVCRNDLRSSAIVLIGRLGVASLIVIRRARWAPITPRCSHMYASVLPQTTYRILLISDQLQEILPVLPAISLRRRCVEVTLDSATLAGQHIVVELKVVAQAVAIHSPGISRDMSRKSVC